MARSVLTPNTLGTQSFYVYIEPDEEDDFIIDDFVQEVRDAALNCFNCMVICKDYMDREMLVIAKNQNHRVVVSEYCNLVSISIEPHGDYAETLALTNIPKMIKKLKGYIQDLGWVTLKLVGRASNGEAFYEVEE